jgi:hypothetical protein
LTGCDGGLLESLRSVAGVASQVLPTMRDETSGLFIHSRRWRGEHSYDVGTNALYSAASLVGLLHERPGLDGCREGLDEVSREALTSRDASVLGASLWALALGAHESVGPLIERIESKVDPTSASTMGLGLVLTGLASASDQRGHKQDIIRLARFASEELERRFLPASRLFALTSTRPSVRGATRRRVTSFAAQVYPILGLCHVAASLGVALPRIAGQVSRRVCEAQGPLGQWPWLYSIVDGRVLSTYPVYSVHQDAMAFMLLIPVGRLTDTSFDRELESGLAWLFGRNELETPLIRLTNDLHISRSIQHGHGEDSLWGLPRGSRTHVLGRSWVGGTPKDRGTLRINRECRPYHLGWALYAHALVERRTCFA